MTSKDRNLEPARTAGFALIELTIVGVIMGVVMTSVGGVFGHARAEQSIVEAYEADLQGLRRALNSVEADLRLASSCEVRGRSFTLAMGEHGVVHYRCDDEAALIRTDADGRERTVARCVDAVDIEVEGCLVRVGLRMRKRRSARSTVVRTAVAMRNGGER